MIALIRNHALVCTARLLVLFARMADFVRKAACRKAGVFADEATTLMDARDAAWRAREER